MATAAQIRANRANAQRSTGPRTARGKDASSRNRLCHGLRSKSAHHLLEPRLSRIQAEFEGEHRPQGEAQRACVMAMAICAARTYQIDALMEEASREADPRKVAGRMMTLAQYALAAFGGFCKALERLEKLKLASNVARSARAIGRVRGKAGSEGRCPKTTSAVPPQRSILRGTARRRRQHRLRSGRGRPKCPHTGWRGRRD